MTLMDVSGAGLFTDSHAFASILGAALKLVAGGFFILMFAVFAFIASAVYSIYRAMVTSSAITGLQLLLRSASYSIGATVALLFLLIAGVFFAVSSFKLLIIATVIALASAFLVRETVIFLTLKRFGKYIFLFSTLRHISKVNEKEIR
jgi:hypothetical protein